MRDEANSSQKMPSQRDRKKKKRFKPFSSAAAREEEEEKDEKSSTRFDAVSTLRKVPFFDVDVGDANRERRRFLTFALRRGAGRQREGGEGEEEVERKKTATKAEILDCLDALFDVQKKNKKKIGDRSGASLAVDLTFAKPREVWPVFEVLRTSNSDDYDDDVEKGEEEEEALTMFQRVFGLSLQKNKTQRSEEEEEKEERGAGVKSEIPSRTLREALETLRKEEQEEDKDNNDEDSEDSEDVYSTSS